MASERQREVFTSRLEAFSDLVFGFSLSLLATRLDVPARVEEIFQPSRWLAIIATFGFVCRFWLEHFRIFRHRFRADGFDATVNFVFLFGIAILPYAVQTFLRYQTERTPFVLYLGDFSLVLTTLTILRLRGLRQRRGEPEPEQRVKEWRRSLMQAGTALVAVTLLAVLNLRPAREFVPTLRGAGGWAVIAFVGLALLTRRCVRRLPRFLA